MPLRKPVPPVRIEPVGRLDPLRLLAELRRPSRSERLVFVPMIVIYGALVVRRGFDPVVFLVVAVVVLALFVVVEGRNLRRIQRQAPWEEFSVVVRLPDVDGKHVLVAAAVEAHRVTLHDGDATVTHDQATPPTLSFGRQSRRVRKITFDPHGRCPAWCDPVPTGELRFPDQVE